MYNKTNNFTYVLCEYDKKGAHIVGYFSKERKVRALQRGLHHGSAAHQCKATVNSSYLPHTSYPRSTAILVPEKPLSDLGEKTYMKYWCTQILREMTKMETKAGKGLRNTEPLSMRWRATNISKMDIETALEYMADKVPPVSEDGKPFRYNEMYGPQAPKAAICTYTLKPFVYEEASGRQGQGKGEGQRVAVEEWPHGV